MEQAKGPAVIVGAGVAGLSVALAMAPRPVILMSRAEVGALTSSDLAQGGVAAAVGADDQPALHAADTLAAGAGLCEEEAVHVVTEGGPAAIDALVSWGVPFDRDETGALRRGLEAAHSRRRILHANGDGTGAAITRALAARARATPSIMIMENVVVLSVTRDAQGVTGVVFMREGSVELLRMATDDVILATGGVGALWGHTTNPTGSWGSGLILAGRAGAVLRDLEFVQFHPTAIDVGQDPLPLASEALRGEGAILINDLGEHFMQEVKGAELAARDVVARAIWEQIKNKRKVFLDSRKIEGFAARFPTIYAFCRDAGIDPQQEPIPIRPVAHYHMGGVAVDLWGRSSVPGLWACGEVASTGVQGANRLASNSLLEGVVMGRRVAEALASGQSGRWAGAPQIPAFSAPLATLAARRDPPEVVRQIRALMIDYVGVLREEGGLTRAVKALQEMAHQSDRALMALMIATAALRRQESRGAHYRTDFPAPTEEWLHHQDFTMDSFSV